MPPSEGGDAGSIPAEGIRHNVKDPRGESKFIYSRQESKSGALFHQQMKSRESGHLLLKLVLKDNFVEVNLSRIATS